MAKRKAPAQPPVETVLSRFFLVSINGTNELLGSGTGRIDIKHEQQFGLETIAPAGDVEYCRVAVRLKLIYSGRREKDENDPVRLEGVYEGRFMVRPDVTIEQLDAAATEYAFQYALVSQVYPLAARHMREQLQTMGLTTRHLPIGI